MKRYDNWRSDLFDHLYHADCDQHHRKEKVKERGIVMAESVNVTSAVLDKKMESYHWKANDYVAENELTITITLAEYRDLIKAVATKQHDIDEANKGKYEREVENKNLKAEVESLRARIYELQNNLIVGDKSC